MGTGMEGIGDHAFSMTGDPDRDREAGGGGGARPCFALAARPAGRSSTSYHLDEAKTLLLHGRARRRRFVVEPVGAAGLVLAAFSGHGLQSSGR